MLNHQKKTIKGAGCLLFKGGGGLLSKASGVPRRFPVSAAFLLVATLVFIIVIVFNSTSSHAVAVSTFCSISTCYTAVLYLWREREDMSEDCWKKTLYGGEALLALHALYCDVVVDSESEIVLYGILFLGSFLIISGALLIYRREKEALPAWCLAQRTLANGIASFLVGLMMMGGVALVIYALKFLFGVNLSYKWSASAGVLTLFTLPIWLTLSYFPEGETLMLRQPSAPRFIKATTRWLFIPLLVLYGFILYAYAAKILFTLTLPQGGVCLLVICFILGYLAVKALSVPFMRWNARWVWVFLPLVLVMAVAIGRRICDYGLTLPRFYIVIFNFWTCLYIIMEWRLTKKSSALSATWRYYVASLSGLLLALFLSSFCGTFFPDTPSKGRLTTATNPNLLYYEQTGALSIPAGTTRLLPVEMHYHDVCEQDSSVWHIATRNGEAVLLVAPAKLRALCPAESNTIPSSAHLTLPLQHPAGATCVIQSLEFYGVPATGDSDGKTRGHLSLQGYIFQ